MQGLTFGQPANGGGVGATGYGGAGRAGGSADPRGDRYGAGPFGDAYGSGSRGEGRAGGSAAPRGGGYGPAGDAHGAGSRGVAAAAAAAMNRRASRGDDRDGPGGGTPATPAPGARGSYPARSAPPRPSFGGSEDGYPPFRVRPSLPSDSYGADGTYGSTLAAQATAPVSHDGSAADNDTQGSMRAMLAALTDPTLAPEHKSLISNMILAATKAEAAQAAALAAAQAAQAQAQRFVNPHTAYSVKPPTMVTSKTQTAADQFQSFKSELTAYARTKLGYDLECSDLDSLHLTANQDHELYEILLAALKPVDLGFLANGNGNSRPRSGKAAWANVLAHFEPKTQAHVLTLVRALVASECHSRAKLPSMAKYLGDFQVLFNRLIMTDPTVEEIVVAILLQSLPRDANWSTFVSNLLQYSKDSQLTVQGIVDRVMLFDSAESVRQGPAATTLNADTKPRYTAEERAAFADKRKAAAAAERAKKSAKDDSKDKDKDDKKASKSGKPDARGRGRNRAQRGQQRSRSPSSTADSEDDDDGDAKADKPKKVGFNDDTPGRMKTSFLATAVGTAPTRPAPTRPAPSRGGLHSFVAYVAPATASPSPRPPAPSRTAPRRAEQLPVPATIVSSSVEPPRADHDDGDDLPALTPVHALMARAPPARKRPVAPTRTTPPRPAALPVGPTALMTATVGTDTVIFDTGSNATVLNSPAWFDDRGRHPGPRLTGVTGDSVATLSGVARLSVLGDDNEVYVIVVPNALYVPGSRNLVGLQPLTETGGLVSATVSRADGGLSWLDFGDFTLSLEQSSDGWPVFGATPAPLRDRDNDRDAPPLGDPRHAFLAQRSLQQLHEALGHVGHRRLLAISETSDAASFIGPADQLDCVGCALGKTARTAAKRGPHEPLALKPGLVCVTDVVGPLPVARVNKARYMLLFRDVRGLQRVYALPALTDAHLALRDWSTVWPPQRHSVPTLIADHASYYKGGAFRQLTDELMWHVSLCTPHSHATHGTAERANRTLLDHARAMLHSCRLGEDFWPWATKYAAWLDNRFPPSAGGPSPFEEYFGVQPTFEHARKLGCLVAYRDPDPSGKLAPRARLGLYLGVPTDVTFGTIIVWTLDTRRVVQTRDYRAFEHLTPSPDEPFDHLDPAHAQLDLGHRPASASDADSGVTTVVISTPAPEAGVPAASGTTQLTNSAPPTTQHRAPAPGAGVHDAHRAGVHNSGVHNNNVPEAVPEAVPQASSSPFAGVHDNSPGLPSPPSSAARVPTPAPPNPKAGSHAAKLARRAERVAARAKEDSPPHQAAPDSPSSPTPDVDDENALDGEAPAPLLDNCAAPDGLSHRAIMTLAHETRQALGMTEPTATRFGRQPRVPSRLGFPTAPTKAPPAATPLEPPQVQPVVLATLSEEGCDLGDLGITPEDLNLIKAGQPSPSKTVSSKRLTPTTWAEYQRLPAADKAPWTAAIREEWDSLNRSKTLIPRLIATAKRLTPVIMTCRWLFKRKADGRCKVRLVVRGFQEPGLDGTEDTYSPTPSHLTLRLALVIAASLDFTATNADFKTAFLNALIGLEECLFIYPPQGVTIDGHVLQLAKALYGLASSPLRWFLLVSRLLTKYGLTPHPDEPCLYWSIKLKLIVVVYVDDCRVMGTEGSIAELIAFLNSHYPITANADSEYLSLELRQLPNNLLTVSMERYATDMLNELGQATVRSATAPLPPGITMDIAHDVLPLEDVRFYRQAVGKLGYMVTCWPELAFPFAELSRFNGQPGAQHLDALRHVLRYVNGHRKQGYCVFPTTLPATVTAFCDASFAPDRVDFRSTSGQIVFVGDTPVLWGARRQQGTATSSTMAELKALGQTVNDVLDVRLMLSRMDLLDSKPSVIWCDSQAAIAIVYRAELNATRSYPRNAAVRIMHVREAIDHGDVTIRYVHTSENRADLFTKALSSPVIRSHLDAIRQGAPFPGL